MLLAWLRNWLSGPWLCVQSDRILKEREWLDRPMPTEHRISETRIVVGRCNHCGCNSIEFREHGK